MSSFQPASAMRAVRIHSFGDPSVLNYETDVPVPSAGPGQLLVQVYYSGVNFLDTYDRTGLYPNTLPLIMGNEGAGRIVQMGPGVADAGSGLSIGELVVFFAKSTYAEYVVVEAAKAVRIPAGLTMEVVLASYMQGLTAHYLTTSTYTVRPGDWVLVHAAAGGVGALAVQMAKSRGAKVIGTAGSDSKLAIALAVGCDHAINYSTQDFEAEVKALTLGKGVHVVYDGVGAATWQRSLHCLRRRGTLALFGNASGPVPPINPLDLTKQGSVFLTRPISLDYLSTRAELLIRATDLFSWIAAGQLQVTLAKTLPLSEARQAHELMHGRTVTGKMLLQVNNNESTDRGRPR